MDSPSAVNPSLASAAYALQQTTEVRQRTDAAGGDAAGGRSQEAPPPQREPDVTFSAEARRLAAAETDPASVRGRVPGSGEVENQPTGNDFGRSEVSRAQEARVNSAQSIAQAISAYRETSVI